MAKLTTREVIDGLVSRGLPEHVAKGFAMNAIDESGLETGIEEAEYNVHGTKGYGLFQWTGDRRDKLYARAKSRGVHPSDKDLQLDLVVEELNGPEKRARDAIYATTSPGAAGAAIVSKFLRPAKKHEVERVARYTGRDGNVQWDFEGHADADGFQNAEIDPNTYVDVTAPTRPDVFTVLGEESKYENQPYDSFWGEVVASYQSSSVTSSLMRWHSEGTIDPYFELGDDRAKEIADTIDPRYHDYVMTAGSEEILKRRLQWVEEDAVRQSKLAAGGASAMAAGFLAGAADPVPLLAGIATGGWGAAALKTSTAVGAVATGAAFGAAENLAWEGANKYVFQNPNSDPLMAAILGAGFGSIGGALSRFGGSEAQDLTDVGIALQTGRKIATTPTTPAAPEIGLPQGHMGAAQNTDLVDPLVSGNLAYRTEVRDEDVPYGFGGKARFDVTGQMTTSANPLTRSIGAALAEETAGFTDRSVVADPASARATALERRMVGNFMDAYKTQEAVFLKDQGVGRMSPVKAAKAREDFGRNVRDYVMDPHPPADLHPAIKAAGDNFRQRMAEFHEELHNAGLGDFSKDPNYFPLISSPDNVSKADMEFHMDTMHDFIRQAVLKRDPQLDPKLVDRMAKGYWANIRKGAYGIEDHLSRAMSVGDREAFKEALQAGLSKNDKLTDAELDQLTDAMMGAVDELPGKGNEKPSFGNRHLKRRTALDHNFQATLTKRDGTKVKMRIADLFETDAEMVFRRYSRVMSGRVALANTSLQNPSKPGELLIDGIRSDADVSRLKDAIIESWRQRGVHGTDKRVLNDVANVDFLYKRITGTPVFEQRSEGSKWARRIRDMQFIRLMSNMGLNQVQEGAKIMALTGYRAAFSQMPSIPKMVKGIAAGKYPRNQLEQELQDLTGIGVEYLQTRRALRVSDDRIAEGTASKGMQRFDNALDYASELTSKISMMRYIHDTQQRWAMAAISQQMAQMARKVSPDGQSFDLSKLSRHDVDRLASMGMGTKDLETLFRNILATGEFKGKRLVALNAEQWDADAVSKFRVFVGRYTDRLVQQNDVGGLSKWMSHPIASLMIQFRSFVFGAWAKSTLYAVNHGRTGDPRLLVMLAGELALGMATYAVRMAPAASMDDKELERWEKEVLNPAALAKNGWSRTATASILPMIIDTALVSTPVGPQFEGARSSGSSTDLWFGSPAVDQLDNAQRFFRGAMGAAISEDEDFSKQDARAGLKAFAPWGNWIPVLYGFGALTKGLPDE